MEWCIRLACDEVVIVVTKGEAELILSCIRELLHTDRYMNKPLLDLHEKVKKQVFWDERT